MEFILGLLMGMLGWGWFLIIPLLLVSTVFEHNERSGWAFIFAIPAFVSLAFIFTLTVWQTVAILCAYVPIGLVWSYFRWQRRISKTLKTLEEDLARFKAGKSVGLHATENDIKDEARHNIDFDQCNRQRVILWVMAWPFGVIESFVGDIIDGIDSFIRATAQRTYVKWSDAGKSKIDKM